MTTRCPEPEDVLRSLLPGERDGGAVRAHVASCADCRQIASSLKQGINDVRADLGGPVSEVRGPDCLSDDVIAAFVDGALSTDDHARAVRHLADCARCTAEVAALASALNDPAIRAERERLERGGRFRAGRWGVATGLAAAVVLVVLMRTSLGPRAVAAWDVAALAQRAAGSAGVPSGWLDVPW